MALSALAIPLITQGVIGATQLIKGANAKVDRPVRQTPSSISEATRVAKNLVIGGRPGQSLETENIKKNVANQISRVKRNSRSGSDVTAATTAAVTAENDALTNLGIRDDQFRLDANFALINQLNKEGNEQNKNFDFNQRDKFLEESRRKSALIGAGITNLNTGIKDASTLSLMKKLGMLDILSN